MVILDGPGSHSRAEQWKLLRPVLEGYGIWHKIGYITGDNHGANDVLCRALSEFLREKDITWQAKHRRIRFHGHVVNLAVQAFPFMDSKEAVEVACEEIEELDETLYSTDMMETWEKNKGLGWRQMGPLGKVHDIAIHIRANDYKKVFNSVKKLWEDNYRELPTVDSTSTSVVKGQPDEYELLAQELDVIGIVSGIGEYETYV
ncbi:hypothetical protein GQ44DRAFT_831443 [Phaeosphaeriaceae sp. PMI808]|nr:hypothetical protein GQ44DRAFT_831443 [Phaeosphaeriaceae sp. PMI808]